MVRSATSSHLKEKVVQSPALKQAVGVIEPACRRCGQGGGCGVMQTGGWLLAAAASASSQLLQTCNAKLYIILPAHNNS